MSHFSSLNKIKDNIDANACRWFTWNVKFFWIMYINHMDTCREQHVPQLSASGTQWKSRDLSTDNTDRSTTKFLLNQFVKKDVLAYTGIGYCLKASGHALVFYSNYLNRFSQEVNITRHPQKWNSAYLFCPFDVITWYSNDDSCHTILAA